MRKSLVFLLAVTPVIANCKKADSLQDDLDDRCSDATPVPEITTTSHGGNRPVNGDLVVRGTARHPASIAIRSLVVNGVLATNEGFNYGTWSATLPLDTLTALRKAENEEIVTVPVRATDACGHSSESKFEVRLAVPVSNLDIQPDYPGTETFAPADGTTTLALKVTAAPSSTGARVRLKTTAGSRLLGAGAGDIVVLGGDGTGPAMATVLFTASAAGTAVVTASADSENITLPITVAGPPTLLPSSATLTSDQTLVVSVDTAGRVKSCQATPVAGVLVTSGGQNLMTTPAAVDENGDGKPDITIKVDEHVDEATFTILCQDPYGQSSTGTYTIVL